MKTIVKILSVVDTREYEEVGDSWKPIAGSGTPHTCDRCGKEHEVHATVLCNDGSQMIVGTGCMGAENADLAREFKRLDNRAKRLRSLYAQRDSILAKRSPWDRAWDDICKLPLPQITTETKPDNPRRTIITMGDARVWSCDGLTKERVNLVTSNWRTKRMEDQGFTHYRPGSLVPNLYEIEKQIAKYEQS